MHSIKIFLESLYRKFFSKKKTRCRKPW